jgi:hypothetical protein
MISIRGNRNTYGEEEEPFAFAMLSMPPRRFSMLGKKSSSGKKPSTSVASVLEKKAVVA